MYFDNLKEFSGFVLFLPSILLKEVARRMIWELLTEQNSTTDAVFTV